MTHTPTTNEYRVIRSLSKWRVQERTTRRWLTVSIHSTENEAITRVRELTDDPPERH